MKNLAFLLLLFVSMGCFAQAPKIINWNDCDMNNTFVQIEHEAQWKGDMASLAEYFNKNIHDPQLEKVKSGRVLVGVLVAENGKTCCKSFGNLTSVELNAELFKEAVNAMPDWTPALQKGHPARFLKQVLLIIKDGKFYL